MSSNENMKQVEGADGWFVPGEAMSDLAQSTFIKMMNIIKKGGQVDVVARCNGKDYRWECDALKYARRAVETKQVQGEG